MNGSLRMAAAASLAACAFGAAAQGPYQLGITDPLDQATVDRDTGPLLVRVVVVPELADGDQLELLADGFPVAHAGAALEFRLAAVAPGPHVLQARIIDSTGNVGAISPANVLTVVGEALPESDARKAPDPILDLRWGPGDADRPVSLLHFTFG